jgi:hypothetical protein
MACCTDEASCPLHKSESHQPGLKRVISQAQADSCCAGSQPNDSTTPGSAFILATTLAPAIVPAPLVVPLPTVTVNTRRVLIPPPGPPVLIHILLSTLVV